MTIYIQIKEGVDLTNLQPPITAKLWEIAAIFDRANIACVMTSARRPAVGKKSFHHFGLAVDLRANHISSESLKLKLLAELMTLLGSDYDVILHGEGANLHYHVEYDPD